MPKDSQLDPKDVRRDKARGRETFAASGADNGTRNGKKQSGSRRKPGNDK